jgi:hypothetical protein
LNVNDAEKPGCPRLQIAKTGLTTGELNVIVLVPVKLPFRKMASPTVLGEVVTVPPIKEEFGNQMALVPFVTAESSSPA